MKESKPYPVFEEEVGTWGTVQEPVSNAACAYEEYVMPDGLDYVHVVDGVLQVSADIEDEIDEVEGGEVVSLDEFKNMFAKWL